MLDKSGVTIEEAICIGCTACVDSCPTDILRMNQANKAYVAYPDDCQMCFLCAIDCPVKAITVRVKRLTNQPEWREERGG